MSGIFKGDSIYKSGGGGGGGYKDGGALVDGDLIEVENNSISTYENESRGTVNFYINKNEGDVINAVIQMTTQVNATVNVYVLQNGFYVPLGNIGGDSVNANSENNINITGNTYSIEEVTPPDDVLYIDVEGNLTKAVKIGDLFWTDYIKFSGSHYIDKTNFGFTTRYYQYSDVHGISGGWRIPSGNDINALMAVANNQAIKLRSTSGWTNDDNGTDDFGFGGFPTSYLTAAEIFPIGYNPGNYFAVWLSDAQGTTQHYKFNMDRSNNWNKNVADNDYFIPLKLCKDV